MRINRWIKLILWLALFEMIGALLGLLTQANLNPWYAHLHKSALTPPGVVFSIVWTALYALLALGAWILTQSKSTKIINYLYALQMLMNWAWTPLFFHFHFITFSAVWLIALTGCNLLLILKTQAHRRTLSLLLIPYTLWLMFASYLNVTIALMN